METPESAETAHFVRSLHMAEMANFWLEKRLQTSEDAARVRHL
jgi:hypothetical protein